MKNWKPILAVLLIFAAGVATGAMAARAKFRAELAERQERPRGPGGPRPGPPGARMGEFREKFIEGLKKDVGISDEQAKEIDRLMRESQERMAKIWEPVEPKAKAEFEATHQNVKALLTPEQQVKFEEMRKRHFDGRRGEHKRREGGGPGHPPLDQKRDGQ